MWDERRGGGVPPTEPAPTAARASAGADDQQRANTATFTVADEPWSKTAWAKSLFALVLERLRFSPSTSRTFSSPNSLNRYIYL